MRQPFGIGGILQGVIAVPSLRRRRVALASHRGEVLAGAVAMTMCRPFAAGFADVKAQLDRVATHGAMRRSVPYKIMAAPASPQVAP